MESGSRILKFASAHNFPKFVKVAVECGYELRKVGTSNIHVPRLQDMALDGPTNLRR